MKNRAPATLTQVARAAGVGTTTVSRVINGGERVSPETLKKVNQAIEHLGYMPNQAARVLKGDRTKTIGLIVPSIADSFFSSCAEAAQDVARAHDSLLIVTASQNTLENEIQSVNMLVRNRVDGLMIAAGNSHNSSLSKLLQRSNMPIIAIDRPIADTDIPTVLTDNFEAARSAVSHLVDHGRRRIACLTGERELFTIQERIRGYRAGMKKARLESLLDDSVQDYASALRCIERLLGSENPPDSFFTLKNSTTIYAFEALQDLGVAVPESIALIGFDDFELASTLQPPITVLQQPVQQIGRAAAELLFERMTAGSKKSPAGTAEVQQRILETRLVCRRSCGCTFAK